MLKYSNAVALFVLGLTSLIWVHIIQIIVGLTLPSRDKEAVMSGVFTSMPWNIWAFIGFFASLGFIIWYAKRQGKKELKLEKDKNDLMAQSIKHAVKEGFKESIAEMKNGGQNGQPETTEPTK